MAGIFGALNLNDSDRVFNATTGQQAIYDVATRYIAEVNADMMRALSIFVEGTTTNYTERYKLPGGGRLQRRGGAAPSGAVKAFGSWDVAYPLEDFGAQLAVTDVDMAYMTVAELDLHINTVIAQSVNTVRFEILRRIFNNAASTFADPRHGNLTIQPLANNDAVVYPPVAGSETEATDDHYLESGYLATAISDANNPYITIKQELVEHFGGASSVGSNVVVMINSAETPETEDLTDFDVVPDRFIRPGANADIPYNMPATPGRVIGRTNGVWVVEWDWIPAGFMFGTVLDEPAPLKMRIDPEDTGLGVGLQLVAREPNSPYPWNTAFWRHRFGVGASNRLNGVVMELANGGGYTEPVAYA